MVKKTSRPSQEEEPVSLQIEAWRGEAGNQKFTWKYAFIFFLMGVGGLLFALGFVLIAALLFIFGVLVALILVIVRKLGG